ncbi:MAG: hypothetical protein O3A00_08530 [Planctomycetota bacterium]|nr:hypothetical protein [Planctomycetota bacterium]
MAFEIELEAAGRELRLDLTEAGFNVLEPNDASRLPPSLKVAAETYQPNSNKTPHNEIHTRSGTITLLRFGWRKPSPTIPVKRYSRWKKPWGWFTDARPPLPSGPHGRPDRQEPRNAS